MQKWAHHAPVNYLHKFYLVEAEQAHVLHQDGTARELYDRAIVLAQQNEYVNEEALACELAGKFYLAKKQTKIAQVYLWDAHHGYSRWGAFAKVKDLETRYPRILSQSNLQKTTACPLVLSDKSHPECQTCLLDSTTGHSTVNTPKQSSPNILDLTSILKVSQVIAGEIKLKNLLEKLMKVVVENAGAQTGFLLLNRADTWVIEAKATISTLFTLDTQNEWRVETLQSTILTDSEELSTGIVHYVARTKEYVILNDAAKMGHFTNDSHILKRQPKSVLCAPLINQGHITAIFYLENNWATGIFTQNRIEMLNLTDGHCY
ncbi:MAG: hypothetical protein BWK79_13895 [Beggiatoa sp. IS2]|nr:MAG: hypothetical protein BWK79_13895 [Beggiatoa sp. IS2]